MTIETVYRGHADTGQYDWGREQLAQAMALLGCQPALPSPAGEGDGTGGAAAGNDGWADDHPEGHG